LAEAYFSLGVCPIAAEPHGMWSVVCVLIVHVRWPV
jgi:hypothetical protein